MTLAPEIPQELEDRLIRRLAETANRNKVIEELCLERGLHWQVAEQIVDGLIQTHFLAITRRQSPFLVLVALSILLGGVFLVAWNLLGVYTYFWPYFDPNTPDALGWYLIYADAFHTLLYMQFAPPLFVTGLMMILGSYLGMKDIWASFFEWLDQRRLSVPKMESGTQPRSHETGVSSAETDIVPNEAVQEYIFEHLEQGKNEAELVEELWLKFGILRPQGMQMVRLTLSANGKKLPSRFSIVSVFVALGALLAGLVWVFQFVFLLVDYLSGIVRPLANSWHLVLWLSDIARYIEKFPGLFGLFALGIVCVAGGIYGLKEVWPSIFLVRRKTS